MSEHPSKLHGAVLTSRECAVNGLLLVSLALQLCAHETSYKSNGVASPIPTFNMVSCSNITPSFDVISRGAIAITLTPARAEHFLRCVAGGRNGSYTASSSTTTFIATVGFPFERETYTADILRCIALFCTCLAGAAYLWPSVCLIYELVSARLRLVFGARCETSALRRTSSSGLPGDTAVTQVHHHGHSSAASVNASSVVKWLIIVLTCVLQVPPRFESMVMPLSRWPSDADVTSSSILPNLTRSAAVVRFVYLCLLLLPLFRLAVLAVWLIAITESRRASTQAGRFIARLTHVDIGSPFLVAALAVNRVGSRTWQRAVLVCVAFLLVTCYAFSRMDGVLCSVDGTDPSHSAPPACFPLSFASAAFLVIASLLRMEYRAVDWRSPRPWLRSGGVLAASASNENVLSSVAVSSPGARLIIASTTIISTLVYVCLVSVAVQWLRYSNKESLIIDMHKRSLLRHEMKVAASNAIAHWVHYRMKIRGGHTWRLGLSSPMTRVLRPLHTLLHRGSLEGNASASAPCEGNRGVERRRKRAMMAAGKAGAVTIRDAIAPAAPVPAIQAMAQEVPTTCAPSRPNAVAARTSVPVATGVATTLVSPPSTAALPDQEATYRSPRALTVRRLSLTIDTEMATAACSVEGAGAACDVTDSQPAAAAAVATTTNGTGSGAACLLSPASLGVRFPEQPVVQRFEFDADASVKSCIIADCASSRAGSFQLHSPHHGRGLLLSPLASVAARVLMGSSSVSPSHVQRGARRSNGCSSREVRASSAFTFRDHHQQPSGCDGSDVTDGVGQDAMREALPPGTVTMTALDGIRSWMSGAVRLVLLCCGRRHKRAASSPASSPSSPSPGWASFLCQAIIDGTAAIQSHIHSKYDVDLSWGSLKAAIASQFRMRVLVRRVSLRLPLESDATTALRVWRAAKGRTRRHALDVDPLHQSWSKAALASSHAQAADAKAALLLDVVREDNDADDGDDTRRATCASSVPPHRDHHHHHHQPLNLLQQPRSAASASQLRGLLQQTQCVIAALTSRASPCSRRDPRHPTNRQLKLHCALD